MKPTVLNIRRVQLEGIWAKIRMVYYKALGLTYGKNCSVGKIVCEWPNSVIIGDDCVILDGVILGIGYGFNERNTIEIGSRTFIGHNVEFNCTHSICIGNDVLIATGTKIVDVGHCFETGILIRQQPLKSLPIVIEDDVWIASNCVVVAGVTISKGSVIAAGSVVTKSIPPNEVWGGVPAKLIKSR
jgi:acetyltransferase-like isoleucine patch superfamily enzyme